MASSSSPSSPIAETDTGTSCRSSLRFCAVTMMTLTPPCRCSAAGATSCAATGAAVAIASAPSDAPLTRYFMSGIPSFSINARVPAHRPGSGWQKDGREFTGEPSPREPITRRRKGGHRPAGRCARLTAGLLHQNNIQIFVPRYFQNSPCMKQIFIFWTCSIQMQFSRYYWMTKCHSNDSQTALLGPAKKAAH